MLDLITSYGCRYCRRVLVPLCETIEQPYDVMKSNMAARVIFNSENKR